MKYYIVLLSTSLCMLLFLGFNTTKNISKNKNHNNRFPPLSTLDSLQGKWINEDDSLNVVIINGRYWNEQYNDPNNLISNTYRLYFSDTLVNSQQSFSSISIDTTALTGQYILFASPDHSIDCYYLNGFYHDNIDTTFSISPPDGTMRDLLLFNKAH